MKKIVSVFVLLGLCGVSNANAAPSYIYKDGQNGYTVNYNYTDKPKNNWYATVRAELNLLNWTNTYNSDWVGNSESEDFSFKPVFGGSLAVGKKFNYFWRAELEAGYTGSFHDNGQGFDFTLAAPYMMANAMYDFNSGLYLGAGLGVAFPMTTLDGDIFIGNDRTKTSVSPMAGLMAGFTRKLDDNFVLDLRYRISGFNGTKHTRYFEDTANQQYYLENKIGLILENSFSLGLRYEF